MKVWLIQPAEPMPIEKGGNRLWRTGYTAKLLSDLGHEVTWWASQFSHAHKRMRTLDSDTVEMSPNYHIRFLKALGYRRNISYGRLKDHRYVAQSLREAIENEPKPDIILASFPTIECCLVAVEYGRQHHVPVVVDVRDQWPDVYYDRVPGPLRGLAKWLTKGYSAQADRVFKLATGISGNAWGAVEFGLHRAGRSASSFDKPFAMGYFIPEHTPEEAEEAEAYWRRPEHSLVDEAFTVVFAGSIGYMFDLDTVLEAARKLPQMRFVLAGDGATFESMKQKAASLKNVIMPGRIESPELMYLLQHSHLGIAPYLDLPNFTGGFTNKPIEYLAHGLPVLTPLKTGEMADVLRETNSGLFYTPNDADDLARVLSEAESDRTRLKSMSQAASTLYNDRFQARKVYGDMIAYLEDVVDAYQRGGSS